MELVRQSMIESCNLSQVLRSIHVALLCVQDNREDRPDMSYVAPDIAAALKIISIVEKEQISGIWFF
jgi:hypothetical protein